MVLLKVQQQVRNCEQIKSRWVMDLLQNSMDLFLEYASVICILALHFLCVPLHNIYMCEYHSEEESLQLTYYFLTYLHVSVIISDMIPLEYIKHNLHLSPLSPSTWFIFNVEEENSQAGRRCWWTFISHTNTLITLLMAGAWLMAFQKATD